jgi:hypothetical protein
VWKAVVADGQVEHARLLEGRPVDVGLDERGIRETPPGAPQHGVRQVDRDQLGRWGKLSQAGDQRPGTAADLQDCLCRLQLGGEGCFYVVVFVKLLMVDAQSDPALAGRFFLTV